MLHWRNGLNKTIKFKTEKWKMCELTNCHYTIYSNHYIYMKYYVHAINRRYIYGLETKLYTHSKKRLKRLSSKLIFPFPCNLAAIIGIQCTMHNMKICGYMHNLGGNIVAYFYPLHSNIKICHRMKNIYVQVWWKIKCL